jgi:outer membrane protein TolC
MTVKIMLAALGLVVAGRASALQPLEEFLRGARSASPENAEARAESRRGGAEAAAALGRTLPRLSLLGQYTRNQDATALTLPGPGGAPTTVTLTPREQWDGTATLDVPLIDLARFAGVGAARAGARAAEAERAATALRVEAQVTQAYWQLVANDALVGASRRALEVAQASLRIADQRHRAGSTGLLDVDRARAEVERDVQQLAGAELQVALTARALRSLSGIEPALEGGAAPPADDLHEEAPLERFQPADRALPALAAAMEGSAAAAGQARAQRLALAPSLAARLTERVTSAEGLSGREDAWQAVVGLTWSFDLTTLASIRAQDAAADAARAREERARLAVRDDIHRAWSTVRTQVARSRSARVEAEVSARASSLALDRYQAGAATQLDLLQAQRDAFAAAAARIQADADLVNARAQLRLAAGQSLLAPPAEGTP